MEQLRPKDLFYQILHGLRSLTRYDHSAALLDARAERGGVLELVAEQIAWRKGKSRRDRHAADRATRRAAAHEGGEVSGSSATATAGVDWTARATEALARLLDYDRGDARAGRGAEGAMLCAPLVMRRRGRRRAQGRGPLRRGRSARTRPISCAASCRRSRSRSGACSATSLARDRHARGGEEARDGQSRARRRARRQQRARRGAAARAAAPRRGARERARRPRSPRDDLAQIEASVQVCRRIFGGMLSFAKSPVRGVGEGDVRRAVESTLAILDDALRRQRHRGRDRASRTGCRPCAAARATSSSSCSTSRRNARDAMPEGGTLSIRAAGEDGSVVLEVARHRDRHRRGAAGPRPGAVLHDQAPAATGSACRSAARSCGTCAAGSPRRWQ